jgi:hypothetical protein
MAGGVTLEQIERAKEMQILDYILANESHNIKRSGGEYRLRDHNSLTISNGMWNWRSRSFGCRAATALNYHIEPRAKPPPNTKQFPLPPRSKKTGKPATQQCADAF